MLSKSLLITFDKLKPNTIEESLNLSELLEYCICFQIRKNLDKLGLQKLNVFYNYNNYKIDSISFLVFSPCDYDSNELSSINNLIERFIIMNLEEFNLYNKNNILNFNSIIINKTTCVLMSDVF